MSAVRYDSYTAAREHLKDVLDRAEQGQLVTVRRDSATAAVLDAARLKPRAGRRSFPDCR
jgi:prevent-host-death family protein